MNSAFSAICVGVPPLAVAIGDKVAIISRVATPPTGWRSLPYFTITLLALPLTSPNSNAFGARIVIV